MSDPRTVADAMFARDRASQAMGMEVVEVGDGTATLTMTVRADMVNGLDVCHGGIVFTLADSAMAFASNGADERALANSAGIDWLAPARRGQVLTASATTIRQGRRAGLHDVTVTADDGTVVAVFRGRTTRVGGPVIEQA